MHKDEFISTLAKICYYAQEYSRDWEYPSDDQYMYDMHLVSFSHVSHVIACFLAQSTVDGQDGIESNVVLDALMQKPYNLTEWCDYFHSLISTLEYDNCNYNCG